MNYELIYRLQAKYNLSLDDATNLSVDMPDDLPDDAISECVDEYLNAAQEYADEIEEYMSNIDKTPDQIRGEQFEDRLWVYRNEV